MANIIGISSTRMLFGSCVSAVTLSFVVGAGTAYAAGDIEEGYEINTGYFGGVAIKGYDPVAYFRMQQALKGSEEYAHEWLGVTWHFANDAHRDAFAETPGKYAPQYGGHCADGVAYGQSTANIDPEAWTIIDGRLYLNFAIIARQELEEVPGQLAKADTTWPQVKAGLAEKALSR